MALTSVGRVCPQCGARPSSSALRFCEYCGTELPWQTVPQAAPPPTAGDLGDVAVRFRALETHPNLASYLEHTPSALAEGSRKVVGIGFFVLFLGVSVFLFLQFQAAPAPGWFAWFPLIFIIAGLLGLFQRIRHTVRFASAELQALPALVADERTEVTGSGGNSEARTRYFVTLQFSDGSRRECPVFGSVAGELTRGDMGVAYLKGPALLEFRRIQV